MSAAIPISFHSICFRRHFVLGTLLMGGCFLAILLFIGAWIVGYGSCYEFSTWGFSPDVRLSASTAGNYVVFGRVSGEELPKDAMRIERRTRRPIEFQPGLLVSKSPSAASWAWNFTIMGVVVGRTSYERVGNHEMSGAVANFLALPIPLVIALLSIIAFAFFRHRYLLWFRLTHNLCQTCGYDLKGGHDRCPECGKATARKKPVNM